MKIALIHIRYIYKGGLESRLFNYIEYFIKNGHEVHLYTSKVANDIIPPKELNIHLLNIKHIPKPIRNFAFDKKLKKILDRSQYDFILSLERTSRQYHVIAPSTHMGYLEKQNSRAYNPIDFIQMYLDKKAFMNAKIIYACSTMVKDEISRYYNINSNQVKVLYPPVNLKKFKITNLKSDAKKELALDKNKIYFLLVSTSHKRKGLVLLEKVFSKLPSRYQLLVAGTSFIPKYSNIHSLGFIKNIEKYYAAVNFLIHPAIYEPFGQIVIESLAMHTPVIISSNVGAKELVTDEMGIKVSSFEEEHWLEAVKSAPKKQFNFTNIHSILEDLSVDSHMKKMLNWALIKKIKK